MFDKRKLELHAKLEETIKLMPARETTSLKDQQQIRDAVNRYCYLRQKTLEDAISFLKDETKNAEQHRYRWENHLKTKGAEAIQVLAESLKDKRPTLFTLAINDALSQESDFYGKLADMALPDTMRGKITEYQKQFETEKKSLLDKWEDLLAENGKTNAAIGDITEQLMKVYEEGLEILEATHTSLRENLSSALWLWAAKEDAEPSEPSVYTPLSVMVDTLNNFMVNAKDISYRFDQLYRSEDSVAVIMFGNTRKSVKEFLENTNLDKAQKDYNEAEKNALDTARNMLSKGQQEDATLFVTSSADITKQVLRTFTDFYNEFVDEFKEIFIGPVGDRTVNDLIKKDDWADGKNDWQTINIQTKLKKIYDDSREWVDLDIFKLTPEKKEQVQISLAKERERLESAITRAGDPSMLDALKMFLTISKDTMFSKIKNS